MVNVPPSPEFAAVNGEAVHVFIEEIRKIMSGAATIPLSDRALGDPVAHGWLRRSELDREEYAAWERPDGSFVALLR